MPSWVVGSAPECDVVVDQPTVSGRHCRVTRDAAGYSIEDLDSTNGTFVDGVALTGSRPVTRGDAVTLGLTTPLPWARLVEAVTGPDRVVRIGRDPDNDVVLDHPAVSGHHAQVVVAGGRATIEDLGSTNGVSIGSPGRFITRGELTEADTVFLGSYEVPASRLLRADLGRRAAEVPAVIEFRGDAMILGRDPDCDFPIDRADVSAEHARIYRSGRSVLIEDLGSSNGTFLDGREIHRPEALWPGATIGLGDWSGHVRFAAASGEMVPAVAPRISIPVVAGLLAQSPLIALLISASAMGSLRPTLDVGNWDRAVAGAEGVAFALGLAALWIGASSAVAGLATRRRGLADLAGRLGVLGGLALAQCLVLLAIVHLGLGLRGSWTTMLAVLALTSWVGLGLGAIASALSPSMGVALAVVAALFVPLLGLAGAPGMPGSASPAVRAVSRATPARWAYEGLLLAESEARPTLPLADAGPIDLADRAFPMDEARMGLRACLLALALMTVGLTAWAGVVTLP